MIFPILVAIIHLATLPQHTFIVGEIIPACSEGELKMLSWEATIKKPNTSSEMEKSVRVILQQLVITWVGDPGKPRESVEHWETIESTEWFIMGPGESISRRLIGIPKRRSGLFRLKYEWRHEDITGGARHSTPFDFGTSDYRWVFCKGQLFQLRAIY